MKYYVYHLIDPRNSKAFYVGKGSGDRINHHGTVSDKSNPEKVRRIRSIVDDGLEVIRVKVALFTDEQDAYDYEREQINSMLGLTNGPRGLVDADYGFMYRRLMEMYKTQVLYIVNGIDYDLHTATGKLTGVLKKAHEDGLMSLIAECRMEMRKEYAK